MGLSSFSTAQGVVDHFKADVAQKVFVVTGGSSGLGEESVRVLAGAGARVVLACRNVSKGESVAESIKAKGCKGTVVVKQLDLTDLASVRACSKDILATERVPDGLLLNAGIMACPLARTADGFESQIASNFIGHFLFAGSGIVKAMVKQGNPSRVVALTSDAYAFGAVDTDDLNWEKRRYKAWPAYGASKTADMLFTQELARRLEGTKCTAYAVHPGVIMGTNLFWAHTLTPGTWLGWAAHALVWPMTKSVPQGTATQVFCLLAPGIEDRSGGFFRNCGQEKKVKPHGRDPATAARLWTLAEKLTGSQFEL